MYLIEVRVQTIAELRAYLGGKPGTVEEYPFGPDTLVLKVGGKIFALVSLGAPPVHVSLKCDPVDAQFLRDAYPAVQPGYHLNKRHWNTVTLDGSVPADELRLMLDNSYGLVLQGLPRAERARLLQ